MTREEILALCEKARDIGTVKHADYADYVVAIESRRRVGEEWQAVEQAYMAVDGKLAMANSDHRQQGKRLEFAEPKILQDTSEHLTPRRHHERALWDSAWDCNEPQAPGHTRRAGIPLGGC